MRDVQDGVTFMLARLAPISDTLCPRQRDIVYVYNGVTPRQSTPHARISVILLCVMTRHRVNRHIMPVPA